MNVKRDSRFELLRIISMLMIVICHVALISNKLVPGNESINYLYNMPIKATILQCLGMFGRIGNLLFIMISGYFLSKSSFKFSRITNIMNKVHIYIWPFIIIMLIFHVNIGIRQIIMYIFPIIFMRYWFVTVFITLLFIAPFINKLINFLDFKNNIFLLSLMIFITTVYPTFTLKLKLSPGFYDLGVFITVYIVAGLIRAYPMSFLWDKKVLFVVASISTSIQFIFCILVNIYAINNHNSDLFHKASYLNSQESVFVLIAAVSIFLIFNNLKPFHKLTINKVAKTTFGVYLIHTHFLFSNNLFGLKIFSSLILNTSLVVMVFKCFVLAILVFGCASIIDTVASVIISKLKLNTYLDVLNNLIYRWYIICIKKIFQIQD